MEDNEIVSIVGTKRGREEVLKDPNKPFDHALRWAIHNSRETNSAARQRGAEITMGASFSSASPL